jgi:hypothetical protein
VRRPGLEYVDGSDVDPSKTVTPKQFVGGTSDRLAITAVRAEQRLLRGLQVRRWAVMELLSSA